jgi:hypothetical protein
MNTRKPLSTGFGVMVFLSGLSACEPEGRAERAGARIDDAAERAAEALDPEGPAERAGEKMDQAIKQGGDALEDLGDKAKEETER